MKKYIECYGVFGMFELIINFVKTKIFNRQSRLIRYPISIRNRKHIDFGKQLTTGVGCRIEAFDLKKRGGKLLIFGENVQINDYVHISAIEKVIIGNNVLIASKVFISDSNHGSYLGDENDSSPDIEPIKRENTSRGIEIEDNVWIGEFVSVLQGVRIGKGSVIGANSVVSKDIPQYSIAVGTPARVIKKYDFNLKRWVKI